MQVRGSLRGLGEAVRRGGPDREAGAGRAGQVRRVRRRVREGAAVPGRPRDTPPRPHTPRPSSLSVRILAVEYY